MHGRLRRGRGLARLPFQLRLALQRGHGLAIDLGRDPGHGRRFGQIQADLLVVLLHRGDGIAVLRYVEEDARAIEQEPADDQPDDDGDVDGLAEAGARALVVERVDQVDELVLLKLAETAGADLDGRWPVLPAENDLGVFDCDSDLSGGRVLPRTPLRFGGGATPDVFALPGRSPLGSLPRAGLGNNSRIGIGDLGETLAGARPAWRELNSGRSLLYTDPIKNLELRASAIFSSFRVRLRCGWWDSLGGAAHCPGGVAGELDGRAVAERKVSAIGQLGDAVDERPRGPGKRHQLAGRQVAGLLRSGDAVEQDLEGILPGDVGGRTVVGSVWKIEHDHEVLGPAQGKLNVAAAAQLQALQRRAAGRHGLAHDGGQPLESLLGDRGEQFVPAWEMPVGRVMGDAGAAGDLAQGEGAGTDLSDEGDGGVEQGLAEVDMMVGLGTGHGSFISEDVDRSNFGR